MAGNLNDTTPSAPANYNNLKWQSDASGNISAYDPGGTWTTWTPTITASASMTVSGVSITTAKYIRLGPLMLFLLSFQVTFGGSPSSYAYASVPQAATDGVGYQLSASFTAGPGWNQLCPCYLQSPNLVFVAPGSTATNFQLGVSYTFFAMGHYQC